MKTAKVQEPHKVKGLVNTAAMAGDFGLEQAIVQTALGMKTQKQKEMDEVGIEKLGQFWGTKLTKVEEKYLNERLFELGEAHLRKNMSSVRQFASAAQQLSSKVRYDVLEKLVAKLAAELLANPAIGPKNLKEAVDAVQSITSIQGKAVAQEILDEFIALKLDADKEIPRSIPLGLGLLNLYGWATNPDLRARIGARILKGIRTFEDAVQVVRSFSSSTKENQDPFLPVALQLLDEAIAEAKDAVEIHSLLRQIETRLPQDLNTRYAQLVFKRYLAEDNLKTALQVMNGTFPKKEHESYHRIPTEWQIEYAEAYDRVNFPLIDSASTLDELRKWGHSDTPSYSGSWHRARLKIEAILQTEIDRTPDGDVISLNQLLSSREISEKQEEQIYQKKAAWIEKQLPTARSETDFHTLWELLTKKEKEVWTDRFLKASAYLYMTDDDVIEVEVPA